MCTDVYRRHARYLESVLATHRKFSEWHKERRLLLVRLCKDIQNDYRKRLDSLNRALLEPSERLKSALRGP
jgi:hypothetical protein